MNVLLTGGAGYIGSHTAVELLNRGCDIVIADDYSNSSPVAVERLRQITGRDFPAYHVDVTDREAVRRIFRENKIDCVIHFAGKKAVGESVEIPLSYYRTNLDAALTVLECMKEASVSRFIFSSSATVYGSLTPIPYREDMPRGECSSPYGTTKAMIEKILEDACHADPTLSAVLLRYFNPIGAHPSGLIGEDPQGIPNNLLPYIAQVAVGRRERLMVFGDDYPTPDGTCRRDYLHVMDLAAGHHRAACYTMEHRTVCWRSSKRSGKPAAGRSPMSLVPAGRAICRNTGLMPPKQRSFSAGRHSIHCRICAGIPGPGKAKTRRATPKPKLAPSGRRRSALRRGAIPLG